MKAFLIVVVAYCACNIADAFSVIKDSNAATLYVVEGKTAQLQCQSSGSFHRCEWVRPTSQVCGISDTDDEQTCRRDGKQEKWIVSKKTNVCSVDLYKIGPSEEGTWSCTMVGSEQDGKSTELKLIRKPKVLMSEANLLKAVGNRLRTLECSVSGGDPIPLETVKWYINDEKINEEGYSITVNITKDWNDKMLRCSVQQKDSFDNILETSDERRVQVVQESELDRVLGKTAKAGEFQLTTKYPQNEKIILAPSVTVNFTCSITTSWLSCDWKHPQFPTPCSIYYDSSPKVCQWTNSNGGQWTVKHESDRTCSITGSKIDHQDAKEWNCHMRSFPIENLHNTYDSVQEYFRVEVITPAQVDFRQLPESLQMLEGDSKELTVSISNKDAFPAPTFQWFVGDQQIFIDGKMSAGSHTFPYEAKLSHSGQRLACKVIQKDDVGNEVVAEATIQLKISENPDLAVGLSTGVLSTIVSLAVLIVLIALIILSLWWTKKACFGARKEPRNGQGENIHLETQDHSVSASFGPSKPPRGLPTEDTQPLLGRSTSLSDVSKLELILSPDELHLWKDEECQSKTTSLSSLDTQVSERDWFLTLKAFGAKFDHLAEMVDGYSSDSSSDSSTGYLESGTEV